MTTSTHTPHDARDEQADGPVGRHRARLSIALLALCLLVTIALIGVASTIVVIGVRSDAEAGRVAVAQGRRALAAGDLERALERFRSAEERFAQGHERASSGLGGLLGVLPVLGRSMDVAAGISTAGETLAGAAADLTSSIAALPDGLGSLAPSEGTFPIDTLASLADEVERAAVEARVALSTVQGTPASLIPAPVADARFQAEEQVAIASRALDASSLLIDGLPGFAGADGPRRYMVIAESPSEQRATGGIWGAYAILRADAGEMSVGDFKPILTLPEAAPDEIPAPNPDYRANWDGYGGAGSWRDMNVTPDFPSAARAALSTYRFGTGEQLDGVIVADPFAVKQLFRVTGPAEIPSLGVKVDARSVVDFMSNEAYVAYAGTPRIRKQVLSDVVGLAFDRFLATRGEGVKKVEAISTAVAGGHLKLYSTDETIQRGLRLAGLDRGLAAPGHSDMLAVHVNSRSASKVDYYAARTVSYDVLLGGEGEAFATTEIAIDNGSPTTGVSRYVIGPGIGIEGTVRGDNVSIVTVSCPGPCELVEAQRNGREQAMRVGEELGRPRYQDFFTTHGGERSTLRIVTRREDVWVGNSSGGVYRLTVLPQTTIQPTEVEVTIHPPSGTKIVWTSEPMQERDGAVVWRATPEGRVDLAVRFRAPAPLRWWRNLTRVFGSR